jgi:hypothetical protein
MCALVAMTPPSLASTHPLDDDAVFRRLERELLSSQPEGDDAVRRTMLCQPHARCVYTVRADCLASAAVGSRPLNPGRIQSQDERVTPPPAPLMPQLSVFAVIEAMHVVDLNSKRKGLFRGFSVHVRRVIGPPPSPPPR